MKKGVVLLSFLFLIGIFSISFISAAYVPGDWQACQFLNEPEKTDCYSHECNLEIVNSGSCLDSSRLWINGSGGTCTTGVSKNRTFCDDAGSPSNYVVCTRNVTNATEYCNGLDDNCDGIIDSWTNTAGGDHCGQDWIISTNTEIAGNHINVRNFIVNPSLTVSVKQYNGTAFGWVEVHAQNIIINGTIDGSGKGYLGASGGSGGNGGNGGNPNSGLNGNSGGSGFGSFAGSGGSGGTGGYGGYYSVGGTSGSSGNSGKYCNGITSVCDTTTNESLNMGSGGGSGGGGGGAGGDWDGDCTCYGDHSYLCGCNYAGNIGAGGAGGGAGGAGGGIIKLYSSTNLFVPATGSLLSKGTLGGNGVSFTHHYWKDLGDNACYKGTSGGSNLFSSSGSGGAAGDFYCSGGVLNAGAGGAGGAGAGGGILLSAQNVNIRGTINTLGGSSDVVNGGTLKIFCMNSGSINASLLYGRLYNTSACGQVIITNNLFNATWTNLNGNIISNSQLGDTVRMVAGGFGFNLTQQINYTIYKNNSFWFMRWVTPLSTTLSNDLWITPELANNVYFKAKLNLLENTSNLMNITSTNDAMPIANIINPVNNLKWSVNYSINFTHSSSDEDDLLKLNWNFGDGTNESYYNYSLALTPNLGNTKHNYTDGGIYTVRLTASEMTRTKSDVDSRLVYILKPGINVMPVITSPSSDQNYSGWVNFNASQSFVANCSLSEISNYNFIAGNLYCKYIHAPGAKITTGYNINLTWTVKELDGSVVAGFPISNSWNNYFYVVDFQRLFISAAKRSAFLSMEYSN